MSIITELSSQRGERTEDANRAVASKCLQKPILLKDIIQGLKEDNDNLIADCAEVLTFVAEQNPKLVKPYIKQLLPLLDHKKTKVRWEIIHTLSFIVEEVPTIIRGIFPKLKGIAILDDSTIVRDYATWTIANYANTGKKAAREAVDALQVILDEWKEKQAAKVIQGFIYAIRQDQSLTERLQKLVQKYERSTKGVVKRAVREFYKSIE
ncbi:MAG: hypothetical protein HYV32_05115 [Candidatus Kerfeldbacteria bacterium]|nr:hypothetical protein [Candidatus Kerfeldbacteria bacterium]